MRQIRIFLLVMALATIAGPQAAAQRVRIAVLGLFHPRELVVETVPLRPLLIKADGHESVIGNAGRQPVSFTMAGHNMAVRNGATRITAKEVSFSSQQGGDADFVLIVPGKLRRQYHGKLRMVCGASELVPVVEMDLEIAVASIVAAESARDAPLEALKAQAVVTRSYLVAAGPRHAYADFCDTTHCQFLRWPPRANSAAATATGETKGLVLEWRGSPFAAMYSASCGGKTRTLAEVGIATRDYPYFAVECPYCRRSPDRWSSVLAEKDAGLLGSGTEAARLRTARKVGWSVVPSNAYTARAHEGRVVLEGVGHGHGVGLCERGAAGMARGGKNFRAILAHYFPNATVGSVAKTSN